jgi:Na+/H+ antiporter NhaD/arsenite permease-like protein
MFLFGILMAVQGLAALGYLAVASELLYTGLGPMAANLLVGVMSALVESAPMMYFVLGMDPTMSEGQWLLVTFTTGVGGSLLAIGSSAGIAAMGQARGVYTFFRHLRWSWTIAVGFLAGALTHVWLNAHTFA